MSQYLLENHKVGDFNPQRTFFGSFFVIPQCLASIRAVVSSVFAKCSVLGAARAESGKKISKNGGRPQRRNRKCNHISPRTLRREISNRRGHSPGSSL